MAPPRLWKVVDVQEFTQGGELESALNTLQAGGWTIFSIITMKEWLVKIVAWTQP
jgi:hypothetical protein